MIHDGFDIEEGIYIIDGRMDYQMTNLLVNSTDQEFELWIKNNSKSIDESVFLNVCRKFAEEFRK